VKLVRRHDWTLTPAEAVALQRELRPRLISNHPIELSRIRLVAGVDVSVKDERSRAAVVVLTFPGFRVVETALAEGPTPFPYVPGLLTFREGPVLEQAFASLQSEPDAFLFDGMGIAHPRRMGIAAHLGLWLERPTIGCGKTRLVGRHGPVPAEKGGHAPLVDRGEVVGAAVRTRAGTNPLFVSPGHLADVPSAVALALACAVKYRLPEPTRVAHRAAGLGKDGAVLPLG
jgi:deoxyribonuclease V